LHVTVIGTFFLLPIDDYSQGGNPLGLVSVCYL